VVVAITTQRRAESRGVNHRGRGSFRAQRGIGQPLIALRVHARLGRDRVSDSVSTVAAKRKFSASEDKTHPKKVGENFIERGLETE
jgi:hypothetical protein